MNLSIFNARRFIRFLFLLFVSFACCGASHAASADCSAGTLVTVVAHLDDDLLFVEPGISEQLRAGWCVTTVHLIGGANGANFAYVQKREQGSRLAYARMAGVPNDWDETTVRIAGKPVFQLTLKAQPKVRLLELRLPGGAVRGGRVPLALLWDQGATITTYPMGHGEIAPARYTRDSLSAVLRSILQDATRIYTLNPDTVPFIEHPDHIYSARITRHVAQILGRSIPIAYHITYPTGTWPSTLYGDEAQRKRDISASYFTIDGGDFAHVFGEYQWDGNWILRRYARFDTTGHATPDFVALPTVLFNTASSECLTSTGSERKPELAPCDGSVRQQWMWEPRPTYAGNQHNAALVSASTRQCVAEHNGTLTEETCDSWDESQRWTPWDFGLIFTPSRRCLGEESGRLNIRGCASLTTRYRWSTTRPTWATDLRLAGAMYGDVSGRGESAAVYVQRRADGPGFDVNVQALSKADKPVRWYANTVPFDSRATTPTCRADSLCFDSARFLLGDFDGDGRADLMVVTPRNGGTAFWLLRSTGSRFTAPVLWFQSDSRMPAGRVQQITSYSIKKKEPAKVLIAIQKRDNGVELWTASADPAGHVQQTQVLDDSRLKSNLRLLAVPNNRADAASFVAVQPTDDNSRIAIVPLDAEGGHWSVGAPAMLPATFKPDMTKFATSDPHSDADADASVVMTVPHFASPGGVDVWKLDAAHPDSAPVPLASLRGIQWQDTTPAVTSDGKHSTLVFYQRADAILDNTLFTAGNAALVQYAMNGNSVQALPTATVQLPAMYSETLWLERLTQ
ncbi:RICIN domain-containing protein [Paraburkholderia diazotrophica]|uniref:RICIN domain-containing protein n=1 Tax=Paraburkholderia diazotrophica TaxID=667676 RepID=UPI0031813AF6